MNRKTLTDIVAVALVIAAVAGFLALGALLQWWRCGEMFPNARFACFLGAR